jgi:Spy/CpxP family protein refolding chaperone
MDRDARRDWQVRIAALAIFILGFAAGALALNAYRDWERRAAGPPRGEQIGRMFDQLNLTDDQRTQVKAIFDDARSQMAEVRKECGPKFHDVRERTDTRLREVLTPEQWEQFQRMASEARERHPHDWGDRKDGP